jgi:hypothetical protein
MLIEMLKLLEIHFSFNRKAHHVFLLHSITAAEECDTTNADQRSKAGYKNIFLQLKHYPSEQSRQYYLTR